jgi:Domain of unknown function (DUF5664)
MTNPLTIHTLVGKTGQVTLDSDGNFHWKGYPMCEPWHDPSNNNAQNYANAAKPTESDPTGRDPHAPGAKLDAGKPRPWLCLSGFARALAEVADVTTFGARKYTPGGWATVPNGQERYMEAFARHMLALGQGEVYDPETMLPHKAHMIWNLMAALELELREGEQSGNAK